MSRLTRPERETLCAIAKSGGLEHVYDRPVLARLRRRGLILTTSQAVVIPSDVAYAEVRTRVELTPRGHHVYDTLGAWRMGSTIFVSLSG